jgi:two-component system sensor histidine kinase RegB
MSGQSPGPTASHDNLRLLTQLRWIAVAGQLATMAAVNDLMGVPLPLAPMLGVVIGLVVWNFASILRARSPRPVTSAELFIGLLVDVLMLSAQLYLSGGATNPFVSLFLLQVILGAVLLGPAWAAALTAVTAAAFVILAERHLPLALPHQHSGDFFDLHVLGMFVCFVLTAGLLLFFLTRIAANQRAQELRLAELRQRAVDEAHVTRIGLLAAGAAHELGTPLSTLSVILSDWKRLNLFRDDAEARAELATLASQVERCKVIVSGVLQSSGAPRGEGTLRTTVRGFLDEAVAEWSSRTPAVALVYDNAFSPDAPFVSDLALKQLVANLLDNATDTGSPALGLTARRAAEALEIVVWDEGPGFEPGILARLGQPYVTTKDKPGGGLGLFLVTNVVRRLGGGVVAANREAGGAVVTVTLPLAGLGVAA